MAGRQAREAEGTGPLFSTPSIKFLRIEPSRITGVSATNAYLFADQALGLRTEGFGIPSRDLGLAEVGLRVSSRERVFCIG
jgi:hypothetical protein